MGVSLEECTFIIARIMATSFVDVGNGFDLGLVEALQSIYKGKGSRVLKTVYEHQNNEQ